MGTLQRLSEIWVALRGVTRSGSLGPQAPRRFGAAVDWIRRAQLVTHDGGISKGYSLLRGHWASSYPETTGYTIPTLLRAADSQQDPALREMALSLAEYLLGCMTIDGGAAHWASPNSSPVVFDTGQVMFGWLSAFDASTDDRYLGAAVRAGDWLVSVQDDSGMWAEHQHLGVAKVIDTRVAWALLELSCRTGRGPYRRAAVRNLEWALGHQDADGWFRQCAFAPGQDPFTHTIAYTAEGLLECGCLLDDVRYREGARLTADALLARQCRDGRLASTYGPRWQATSRSTCLTGDCQVALLWLRLYGLLGQTQYLDAARKAVAYVASTQHVDAQSPNIRGAIAGSYPVWGRYERFQYPNWAAKFFVDALLALQKAQDLCNVRPHRATSFPG